MLGRWGPPDGPPLQGESLETGIQTLFGGRTLSSFVATPIPESCLLMVVEWHYVHISVFGLLNKLTHTDNDGVAGNIYIYIYSQIFRTPIYSPHETSREERTTSSAVVADVVRCTLFTPLTTEAV